LETKRMEEPSGDQTGSESLPPAVNLANLFFPSSATYTPDSYESSSRFACRTENATLLPSGEKLGSESVL